MEKQRLLYQQSRLHNRGAAEMVLQMISACKGAAASSLQPFLLCGSVQSLPVFLHHRLSHAGDTGPMVTTTLKLGISILNGGNSEVQRVRVLESTHFRLFQDECLKYFTPLLAENAGVSEGQEGCGLLPESAGTDADMLVRIHSAITHRCPLKHKKTYINQRMCFLQRAGPKCL